MNKPYSSATDREDREDRPAFDKLTPSERKLVEWAKRKREQFGELGLLLEGEKIISEALDAGLRFEAGWITNEAAERERKLLNRLKGVSCPVRVINERVMRSLSELDTPPGAVVAAHSPHLLHKRPEDPFNLIIALFGAQDPGNVGGVMRTADYFGADEVWLDRASADPYSPKGLRGSMGAFLRIPVYRGELGPRIQRFRDAGAKTCAAIAHGTPSAEIGSLDKCLLMIGNESRGLAEKELTLADHTVVIPGAGRSESLNLGVAAGILIYTAMKGKMK